MARPADTDVLRWVDDAGDGCDNLVIDGYGTVARIEIRGEVWPNDLDAIKDALLTHTPTTAVVALLRKRGERAALRIIHGAPADQHVVTEAGMQLQVRLVDAAAPGTGVFVDQRVGRAWVRAAAAGVAVLNLFAHAGAFGVAAALGGAVRVDHVDAAKKCAPWAADNLLQNGIDPRRHRFIVDDALMFLRKAARRARSDNSKSYGVVVCDPPTTALRPDGARFLLQRDLHQLAADACGALGTGGSLLLSTNDRSVNVSDVQQHARTGAAAAGRDIRALTVVPLPPDITSGGLATLRPMRGVWMTLV